MRAVALVALAALLATVSGCKQAKPGTPDEAGSAAVAVEVAKATVQPMEVVLTAQGTLVPPQGASVKIAVVAPGRLQSVPVHEGDRVTAGQVVAVVDSRVQQAQTAGAVSALRTARIQADEASLAARAAATDQANAVKVARLDLQTAQTELAKLRKGARPQEIRQAELAVAQSKATYDRSLTEQGRVRFLYQNGVDSKRELDDANTAVAVAKSAWESAKQQADLVKAGARSEDLRTAELHVETAKAGLEQAQRGSVMVAAKRREADAMAESVKQKAADVAAARTTASTSVLRSPIGGTVVRRLQNPGDMADPASPIMEISRAGGLDVACSVPSEDAAKLRVGMSARVSVVGGVKQQVMGRVLSIGQVDPQTGLLAVRVTIATPGALKAGAYATVDVILSTTPHAVVVPKQAVITKDESPVVFVVGPDQKAHQKAVTTGAEAGGMVEIKSGVSPGETVVRLGEYELADGAKVKPAEKGSPEK